MRVGFVGCGLIAGFHARNLTDVAEIVACYDIDATRSAMFSAEYGGDATNSAAQVIERSDAVYVCTWTSAHPRLVEAVSSAGKAIFCEKPLGVDWATAKAMTDVVERAGVVNQVGLVLRHSPAFRWVRHRMNEPSAGPIMTIVFRDDQYLPIQGLYGSTWRIDRDKAGSGTLLEHSIHDLDLLQWMMGPVGIVGARTADHHGHDGIEDLAVVWLATADGSATATLTSIWHDLLDRPSQRRVEVFCRDAYFSIEGDWNGPVHWERNGESGSLSGQELAEAAHAFDGRSDNPDAEFVAALRSGTPAYPDFTEALEAHRLCDAAYRSAANGGQPVEPG